MKNKEFQKAVIPGGIPIGSKDQSDKVMNYYLISFYIIGILLSFFYDTWLIGFGVGSLSLIAYYSAKYFMPESDLYQYVLSVVFGFFMAQYIYQMHGLFEMHFMAFVGSTILITYKNWKLQIPIALVVMIHHCLFNYLQYIGFREIYFSQLPYLDLQTLAIHGILATLIFGTCGLWAYQFRKYSEQIESSNIDLAEKRAELIETNKELERSNYDLMQFAGVASHDLKEPLRKIQSYSDLISTRYGDTFDDRGKKHFKYITEAAHRMKILIEDILQYSKLSTTPLEFKEIDLNDMVTNILSDLEILVIEKRAEISIGQLCKIDGIPGQIRQVFQNLISNALKFTNQSESPKISIHSISGKGTEFGLSDTALYCKLEVSDNGIGFDIKYLNHIFTIFSRLHAKEKYEGTGIGLSVVKKIVDRHKGSITAVSEPGKGSTFIIILPVSQNILKTETRPKPVLINTYEI